MTSSAEDCYQMRSGNPLQWNPDLTKCQAEGEICSGCFNVVVGIHFIITWRKNIARYTGVFVVWGLSTVVRLFSSLIAAISRTYS